MNIFGFILNKRGDRTAEPDIASTGRFGAPVNNTLAFTSMTILLATFRSPEPFEWL